MKNNVFFSIGAFAVLTLVSCGGAKYDSSKDPVTAMYDSIAKADSLRQWGPPKAIKFAEARDTGSIDGTRIVIEGYVTVSSTVYDSGHSTGLQLWERKNQSAGDYVSISVENGNGNNTMKGLPSNYTREDLELKDDKGQEVHYGDRIRVTGMYNKPYDDGYGSVEVQSFEKIADAPMDYSSLGAVKITTDTTGQSKWDGKLVVAEGYLEIPMYVNVGTTAYFDLKPSQNSDDYLTVDIFVGKGPNMVEEIPDNFQESDIKVHAHDDQIAGKKKVRVYGVWEYDRIAAEYIEIL